MDVNALRIVATLASFVTFIGIVLWAYSRGNAQGFDDAARSLLDQE